MSATLQVPIMSLQITLADGRAQVLSLMVFQHPTVSIYPFLSFGIRIFVLVCSLKVPRSFGNYLNRLE